MNARFGHGDRWRSMVAALALTAASLLPGCGSSDGDTTADVSATDMLAMDVVGETMTSGDTVNEASAGLTVNVVYKGETYVADLSKPTQTQIAGLTFVLLSDVVKEAVPDVDFAKVTADFLGSDGFKPGSKGNCAALIPVAGDLLAQGYISPETRNLAWADSLQYPGCMRLSDTAEIELADK